MIKGDTLMTIQIKDKLGRPIRDLRISVMIVVISDVIIVCQKKYLVMILFLPKEELLTFDEITTIAKVYAELGVKKLRITGGEPLLRRDLYKLIEKLNHIEGIEDIGMTTNGLLLKNMVKSCMMQDCVELM